MKKILIILLVLAIAGGVVGYFIYNTPHKDLQRAKADYTMEAASLFEAFDTDETSAEEKYLGKILEVNGTIENITAEEGGSFIMLATGDPMSSIQCEMLDTPSLENFSEGNEITIRGICSGKLMDIVLSRCVIIE